MANAQANEVHPVGAARGPVQVDPALLAVIKWASAPSTGPKPPAVSASIPGAEGAIESLVHLFETLRRGVAYDVEQREKFGDIYRGTFVGIPMVYVWDADEIHKRAEDSQHGGIYNPFGAGAHACVGMQLANMEMKLFWHRMLRSSSFRLSRDYDARHTFTPMGMVSGDVRLTLERVS